MDNKRWFNFRRFLLVFTILQVATILVGCSAAWLGAVDGLLPALSAAVEAVVAFLAALEGKTVSTAFLNAVQKIQQDIAAQITNVQTLIADFKNAATGAQGSILAQIQAVLQGILTNLGSILSGANITDSATVSKLTALVGLAVAAAQAIFGLIPLVSAAISSGASRDVLEAQDHEAAAHVENAHKGLQSAYKIIRDTPTENADVNTALGALPAGLP